MVLQQHHTDKDQDYVSIECVHDDSLNSLDLVIEVCGWAKKNRRRMAGLISPSVCLGVNEALGKDQGETRQIYVNDVFHDDPKCF